MIENNERKNNKFSKMNREMYLSSRNSTKLSILPRIIPLLVVYTDHYTDYTIINIPLRANFFHHKRKKQQCTFVTRNHR